MKIGLRDMLFKDFVILSLFNMALHFYFSSLQFYAY